MRTARFWPGLGRHALCVTLCTLVCLWAWSRSLDAARVVHMDMGPGARDYVQGMSDRWVFDGSSFWRRLETRARVTLPLFLEGPGTLSLTLRSTGSTPSEIRAEADDASLGTLSLAPGPDPVELRWEMPEGGRRAAIRLRSGAAEGSSIEISQLRWRAETVAPSRAAVLAFAGLVLLTYLGLALSGLGSVAIVGGTLGTSLAVTALSLADAFAGLHLASRLALAALIALIVLLIVRWLAPRSGASLRALFLFAVLFKSALLFHPRFYFVDLPIHETLLELVYHRGMVDFWKHLPEYQVIHNLGVAPVGGEYRAFPYSVTFYFLAGLGNRLVHAPELWLKLTASVLAALALFPLAGLSRRFSPRPSAEAFTAIVYLLVPSITRSLLLLELSAIAGCFFDLLAIACLARLSLRLATPARFSLAALAMATALVAYTAGFIHFGLFVASALAFGWLGPARGLGRGDLIRFASAGLLAAALALLAYHPDTVRALPDLLLTGVEEPAAGTASLAERAESVTARVLGFIGIPLLGLGILGVGLGLPRVEPPPARFLFESWALSALAAVGLRVLFPEILLYAKELYWGAAVLAVGAGSLLAGEGPRSRPRKAVVILVLSLLVVAYAASFRAMVAQFYTKYLFL